MPFIIANTKEEKDFAIAVWNNQSIRLSHDKEYTASSLTKLLAEWTFMIEATPPVNYSLHLSFIYKNFAYLTLAEIKLAVELSILGELGEQPSHYGKLSVEYVSNILNLYKQYRQKQIDIIIKQTEQEEERISAEKVLPKPDPRVQVLDMQDIISEQHKQFISTGSVTDWGNIVWNYLKRTKKHTIQLEEREEAMKYAKVIYNDIAANKGEYKFGGGKYKQEYKLHDHLPKEEQEKMYARQYCIAKFHSKINIEDFLKTINTNEFI